MLVEGNGKGGGMTDEDIKQLVRELKSFIAAEFETFSRRLAVVEAGQTTQDRRWDVAERLLDVTDRRLNALGERLERLERRVWDTTGGPE